MPKLLQTWPLRRATDGDIRNQWFTATDLASLFGQIYRDFIQRCNDYEICDVGVPKADDEDEGAAAAAAPPVGGRSQCSPAELAKMNREREEKIRR